MENLSVWTPKVLVIKSSSYGKLAAYLNATRAFPKVAGEGNSKSRTLMSHC